MDRAEAGAFEALRGRGVDPQQALTILQRLREAGFELADRSRDEFVVRWTPVVEQAVPPEADTIIRTLTRTEGARSWSASFWLQGLRGPRFP